MPAKLAISPSTCDCVCPNYKNITDDRPCQTGDHIQAPGHGVGGGRRHGWADRVAESRRDQDEGGAGASGVECVSPAGRKRGTC